MAGLLKQQLVTQSQPAPRCNPCAIVRWRSRFLHRPRTAVQDVAAVASSEQGPHSPVDDYLHEQHYEDIPWDWNSEKERSRSFRRTTFTFADWKRHRSIHRHLRHVKTTFESRIVRAVMKPVVYVVTLSLVVASYSTLLAMGQLPPAWPALPLIPLEPLSITSFALSLLLVFRTNSSYARWDEARRRFGCITTTCRDLGRQALSYFRQAAGKAAMMRWMVALTRACVVHLREDGDLRRDLQGVLRPEEAEAVLSAQSPPMYCIQVVSELVATSGAQHEAIERMDWNLSLLVDALTACDRIVNTPIPLSYTRHTSRFLLIWLMLLPFSLWKLCGWSMVPLTALIAFVLFGIEEIGVQIEEPFSVLALEQLTHSMEQALQGMSEAAHSVVVRGIAATRAPRGGNGNGTAAMAVGG